MDIFLQDPNEIPLPPAEVRIETLTAEPYPDGRRVRVSLLVTPFQQRPNLDLVVTNSSGDQVAQASIIESITRKMELTLHLRGSQPLGAHRLEAILFYEKRLPAPDEESQPLPAPEIQLVDQRQLVFDIQPPA
jgi:hypothetical protein